MVHHEIANFLKRFVVIYGLTMLASYGFCLVFNPGVTVKVVDSFGACFLFSALADATSLVYLSRHELSGREWWTRTAIQCVLLELVLMPAGYYIGMWQGMIGGIVFFGIVLVVRFCVELVGYGQDYADASDVNERLRQRREERSGTHED